MKRSTKSSLLMSVVAMLLCVSMLVGSTFAWFTDSVTATNNVIVAGNLDVELYYQNDETTDWTAVTSASNIFKTGTLWEPGHVEVIKLKVVNEGTLALKYQLGVNIVKEIGSINIEGNPFKLSDHIKFGFFEGEQNYTREQAVAAVDATAKAINNAYNTEIIDLLPLSATNTDNNDIVTMVVYMPETVGNVANYGKGQAVPQIDLGLNLLATQYTYEEDSFDNTYDKDADVVAVVNTAAELYEALDLVQDGGTIAFGADIEDVDGILLEDRNITLDLNGKTFTVSEGASTNNRNLKITGDSVVTIKNGTIVAEGNKTSGAYGTVRTEGNAYVTLENVKLYNYRGNGLNVKANTGTTVIINDSEIYSQYGGGVEAAGGNIELNNVTIVQEGVNDFNAWNSVAIGVNGGGTVTVNSGNYKAAPIASDANASQGTWVAYVMSSGGNLIINGGNFEAVVANTAAAANACGIVCADTKANVVINGGDFTSNGAIIDIRNNAGGINPTATLAGGKFSADPRISGLYGSNLISVADGHIVNENTAEGTWTVDRDYNTVAATGDKAANGTALADAINATTENAYIKLADGEYKMPSVANGKEVTIVGDENTVIDLTLGAYADGSKLTFEGVTIKGSTGMANGNGSDYAAMYTPNVTYIDCTFDGPFRVGRDGAKFINCTFKNLGNDYVWNMSNDVIYDGCTFETDGKALLLYSDGPSADGVASVTVKNCTFTSTKGAKAGAIANQNCAAIEIDNYGCSFNLTTSGNTYDSNFSGEWRIKSNYANGRTVTVNGTAYSTIAIDGKTMTIDASKNVTVID